MDFYIWYNSVKEQNTMTPRQQENMERLYHVVKTLVILSYISIILLVFYLMARLFDIIP